MNGEFEVEIVDGLIELRMEPYVAKSLAGALRELNRRIAAEPELPDSGWADIADAIETAVGEIAKEIA